MLQKPLTVTYQWAVKEEHPSVYSMCLFCPQGQSFSFPKLIWFVPVVYVPSQGYTAIYMEISSQLIATHSTRNSFPKVSSMGHNALTLAQVRGASPKGYLL